MKLAYVTTYDARDVTNWSGIGRYAADALARAGLELHYVGSLKFHEPVVVKLRRLAHTKLLRQSYDPERHEAVARHYAQQVEQRVARSNDRCVLSLGTVPIAFCECRQPIAFWTDATFAGLMELYPGYRDASMESIRNGNALEQAALDRCSAAIYASDWAAQTALVNYRVDPRKVHVVPFGPNRAEHRSLADIEDLVRRRPGSPCRLLFLGVDWDRKGGPLALEVAQTLVTRGVPTELHVAGCEPPLRAIPPFVVRHGFIDKRDAAGAAKIDELLASAHFLVLPSRAECFGLVFLEASSVGVPSLAAQVGGVPSAVRNDRNGHLFPLDAAPSEYADYIINVMAEPGAYERFARSSYLEYRDHLTWDRAAAEVRDLLAGLTG